MAERTAAGPEKSPQSPTENQKNQPSSDAPSGVSRRGFLKGTGSAAGASVFLNSVAAQAKSPPPAAGPTTLGPEAIAVTLQVNGKAIAAKVEPRDTLAAVLRDQLGLSGTKIGCDRGSCGACTVWIDGSPAAACMTLALDVAGLAGPPGRAFPARAITTIEGLAHGGELHPVQRAFVEHDALQCGFCTPGMTMSCAALLESRRAAGKLGELTEQDVRHAVAGNLCRCGSYPHVVSATLAAAKLPAGATAPAKKPGGAR